MPTPADREALAARAAQAANAPDAEATPRAAAPAHPAEGLAGAVDFDVCGLLPGPGMTVLEASAGTGKTFTIAALVARLVAEGAVPLSEILVVTFTRMATGELRERARDRLVTAEAGLGRLIQLGEQPSKEDTVLRLLAEGDADVVALRRQRLADALASFDKATITTTHGFCHAMLSALGVWGEVAPGAALLEDTSDLLEEVVDDLLVRHAMRAPETLPFRRKAALEASRAAADNPCTPLSPAADLRDATPAGLRRRLAHGAREELERRLLEDNLLTYDDLLVRLARALTDGVRGGNARDRLRSRYRAVLVDEFQDTDSVQWEVVRSAFADDHVRLVLIGDPKQAVYSFRGADVYAYLRAAREAGEGRRFTLGCNWRSDAPLIDGLDALLNPLQLGHPEIVYRKPEAAEGHKAPGLVGAPRPAPVRVRVVGRETNGVARTRKGLLQKDAAVRFVAEDLAADVVELLGAPATLSRASAARPGGDSGGDGTGSSPGRARALSAGDIGVLVRTNRQALVVQSALRAAGVPVVVAGAESVLATAAARHWLKLLEALEQPASRGPAASVALTPFIGMSASELAGAGEQAWERLHSRLHEWSNLLRQTSVAALFWHINAAQGLPARLLHQTDGERLLTDLAHVAELLHAEAMATQLGLAALRTWLVRRVDEAATEGNEAEQRSRRLDSDADAVQLLTVHRAKGLEFPVVYCPYLWDPGWSDRAGEPVVFHDKGTEERRLDVGGDPDSSDYLAHYSISRQERRGEDLRHLYVALTRARHQVVVWWAPAHECQHSALGRLLLARRESGEVAPSGRPGPPRDSEVEAELRRLAERAPGLVSVEHCMPRSPAGAEPVAAGEVGPPGDRGEAGDPGEAGERRGSSEASNLGVASFDRVLDLGWRRNSYTSVTAGLHHAGGGPDAGGPAVGGSDEGGPHGEGPVAGGPVGWGSAGARVGGEAGSTGGLVSSEPEQPGTTDEPAARFEVAGVEGMRREGEEGLACLFPATAAGAEFGTAVHKILQRLDFSAADLWEEVSGATSAELAGLPLVDAEELARGIHAALLTPFGACLPGASLRAVKPADRLNELYFELPLAGGDDPRGRGATSRDPGDGGSAGAVLLNDLATVMDRWAPPGHPFSGYAASLAAPGFPGTLRGYLTGSIDLVMRWQGELAPRYFVVDYKTNWLGGTGEQLTTWHYRPPALATAMRLAHYPLQALFYLVALHRYLRWRQPGYDPERHLGGAVYLFLRGMVGPATPSVDGETCGVFCWSPEPSLVTEVSDLLAGEVTRRP